MISPALEEGGVDERAATLETACSTSPETSSAKHYARSKMHEDTTNWLTRRADATMARSLEGTASRLDQEGVEGITSLRSASSTRRNPSGHLSLQVHTQAGDQGIRTPSRGDHGITTSRTTYLISAAASRDASQASAARVVCHARPAACTQRCRTGGRARASTPRRQRARGRRRAALHFPRRRLCRRRRATCPRSRSRAPPSAQDIVKARLGVGRRRRVRTESMLAIDAERCAGALGRASAGARERAGRAPARRPAAAAPDPAAIAVARTRPRVP